MKFSKPALSYQQQAKLLIKRGIIGELEDITKTLSKINYYKLSAYWKVFQNEDETFKNQATFSEVLYRYQFDSQLRNIFMQAIDSLETTLKTKFANYISLKVDPFFYLNRKNLKGLKYDNFIRLQYKLIREYSRSKEKFVKHFKRKYGKHTDLPPVWILIEIVSFGTFTQIFNSIDYSLGKKISKKFNMKYKVLRSWLWTINEVRNICAHHSRLWNKELGNNAKIPHKSILKNINNKRIFFVICIFLWLDSTPNENIHWFIRLNKLLNEYSRIPNKFMGFPKNWNEILNKINKNK